MENHIFLSKVRSSACVITCSCGLSSLPWFRLCCEVLSDCVCVSLSALPKDKMTNGDTSPEEKKQEMEREKLLEDTLVRENHR